MVLDDYNCFSNFFTQLYMKRFSANFVGRENEIKELEKYYNSGRSSRESRGAQS